MTQVVESKIVRVHVFRQGAMVTRSCLLAAEGESLPSCVAIPRLPLLLHDDSLRVALLGSTAHDRGALPRARSVTVTLTPGAPDPERRPARNEPLLAARLNEKKLRTRFEQCKRELADLSALTLRERQRVETQAPEPSRMDARLALLDLRTSRAAVLIQRARQAWEEWEQSHQLLRDLEAKEASATTQVQLRPEQLSKQVLVTLEPAALSAGQAPARAVTLELSYFVRGARWLPSYRLAISDGEAELTTRALVAQATGEDWNGVELTLSTALPLRLSGVPELRALRIGRSQPAPRRGFRPAPEGLAELFADYDQVRVAPVLKGPPPAALPPPRLTAEEASPASSRVPKPAAAPAPRQHALPGPPPPAAAPLAPAPQSMALPPAGGVFAAAVISRSFAEAPSELAPAAKARARLGGSVKSELTVTPADEALSLGQQWLSFDELVLPGPTSQERGKLQRLSASEAYANAPSTMEGESRSRDAAVKAAFAAAFGAQTERAEACESLAAPRGYTVPDDDSEPSVFGAEVPLEVPADGAFHLVPLAIGHSACVLGYVSVPRESLHAFRSARFKNPTAGALLPGPVDVYLASDFLLSSSLRATPRGADIRVGLGVDERIKVARNIHYEEATAGLLRGDTRLKHQLSIRVANKTPTDATIEVRERIPIVAEGDKDIEVELGKVQPQWSSYEPEDSELKGGYAWTVEVLAGQELELRAAYEVRIPSKLELVGGNRREE